MALTITDRSTLPDNLKRDYVGSIQEQLVVKRALHEQLQKGKKYPLLGEDMVIALHLRRTGAVQAMLPSNDYLPNADAPQVVNAKLRAGMIAVGIVLDNTLKLLAKSDKYAFKNALALLLEDARSALFFDIERTDFGDGTGVLGTCAATVTSATVTFDSNQNFIAGMLIDLWTGNTATATSMRVLSVSTDGISVTFDSSQTWTVTTSVAIRAGNAYLVTGTRTSKEANGLRSICNTGQPFMGVDPATYPAWNNLAFAATGPLDPATIAALGVQFRIASEGYEPDCLFVHAIQTYGLVYGTKGSNADRRFTQGDLNQFGAKGDDTFNFGAGPVKIKHSYLCPWDKAFAFVSEHAIQGETSPIDLEDWGGQTTLPYIDGTGYKAATAQWLTYRQNIGCMRRRSFGKITGLTSPNSGLTMVSTGA